MKKFIIDEEQNVPIMIDVKVSNTMNDESTLRDVGCFFFGLIDKNFGLEYNFFGFGWQNYGLQKNKKTGKRNT